MGPGDVTASKVRDLDLQLILHRLQLLTLWVESERLDVKHLLLRLELMEQRIMAQLDDMNQLLTRVADAETKLSKDIQDVIEAIKNKLPPNLDLSQQLNELGMIADKLEATDANTLAQMPPTGFATPPPASHRRGGP